MILFAFTSFLVFSGSGLGAGGLWGGLELAVDQFWDVKELPICGHHIHFHCFYQRKEK